MTVEDNILSVLEMTKLSRKEQLEKLESLIAEFRLGKVRKNTGDRLSGGERRRTEIARCLAINPKFIMLDEPFAGVDPIAVEDIQHIVWKLKDRNIGILITDHNVQETLTITDRAYLLLRVRYYFRASPRNLRRTRLCVRNTSPTRSCCARRISSSLMRNAVRVGRRRILLAHKRVLSRLNILLGTCKCVIRDNYAVLRFP